MTRTVPTAVVRSSKRLMKGLRVPDAYFVAAGRSAPLTPPPHAGPGRRADEHPRHHEPRGLVGQSGPEEDGAGQHA